MAKHYESYNASYPLAYYEIGTIYAFMVLILPMQSRQLQIRYNDFLRF